MKDTKDTKNTKDTKDTNGNIHYKIINAQTKIRALFKDQQFLKGIGFKKEIS